MFRILSLDGGGIRGAFIAAVLARLQDSLSEPIINYFDLITGTSTGGIIAVSLAMGVTPADIRELYRSDARNIFTRPPPRTPWFKRMLLNCALQKMAPSIDADWLFYPKYDSAPLRFAVAERLGERRLGESTRRLAVPAVDLAAGKIVVFKTPHRPNFVRDRHFRAVDVIMATAAAPSYFPAATIEPGSIYCDGGIWANNPALVGYVEAIKISDECHRSDIDIAFSATDIQLLSIGTGRSSYLDDGSAQNSGLKSWAPRLLNVSGEAQSEGIHWQMQYLLGKRYKRLDFDIPTGLWTLDSLETLETLLHIGTQCAVENLRPLHEAGFLTPSAHRYMPFDV